ncbi:MAG TPA: crossover junction endodeoxyribonuclease RuvC [Firmicutes bacterium]|nr:crossover junction endodeoxyribonuclease RuvC [Bacillota bacterium]
MLVLGIDPGIAITGYGFVQPGRQGSGKAIAYGCIRTPARTPLADRLVLLYQQLTELIEEHRPDVLAIEQLFFNRNTTTAFTVAQARGVVVLAAAQQGVRVVEYTPLQVKQAVVGYGRAEKQQVQHMVKALLNLASVPKPDDVADALAIAICHTHSMQYQNLLPIGKEQ